MGIVSVRLNTKEEKILNFLSGYYDKEKSSLIRQSLMDMYEDIIDREEIDGFRARKAAGRVRFKTAGQILKKRKRIFKD